MTQHFTRNTISVEFYCSKCGKPTQHRIDGVKKGPCLECIARLENIFREIGKEKNREMYVQASQEMIAHLTADRPPFDVPLFCRCRSFKLPHELIRHAELKSEYDWRLPEERNYWEFYA